MIIEQRETIKLLLESNFATLDLNPHIFVTGFPENKESMESLQKKAKAYSKGAIFITWTAERPGEKIALIYPKFIDVYTIFIFSNDKDDDSEIIELYEACRDILYKKFYLYYGEMSPVKTAQTGLYMAAIQVGTENIYQGVS